MRLTRCPPLKYAVVASLALYIIQNETPSSHQVTGFTFPIQPLRPMNKKPSFVSSYPSSSSSKPIHTLMLSSNPQNNNNNNNNNNNTDSSTSSTTAVLLKKQAERVRLEAEKMEASLTIDKINSLESRLQNAITENQNRDEIRNEILQLWKKLDPNRTIDGKVMTGEESTDEMTTTTTTTTAKRSLSPEEITIAAESFISLPPQVRIAFAKITGYTNGDLNDITRQTDNAKDIVSKLHSMQDDILNDPSSLQNELRSTLVLPIPQQRPKKDDGLTSLKEEEEKKAEEIADLGLFKVIEMESETDKRLRYVESSFPSVTRKEGMGPTLQDAQQFFDGVLLASNQKGFNPTSQPEAVSGGYIIRGDNQNEDGESMITNIERQFRKYPDLYDKINFYYIKDPTPEALDDVENLFGKPVIYITGRDLAPTTSPLILSFVSAGSLFLLFLFALGTFSTNELIMDRLTSNNSMGNYDVSWFNNLLFPMVASICSIQALHEGAHLLIAKRDQFKIAPPTILPSFYLPFLGCSTAVKTSPPNNESLFDFALAGPLVGMISSLALLLLGLQLTISTTDPEVYKYFPTLSSSFLHLSSLGSNIVDEILGYGDMLIPSAKGVTEDVNVSLHPFAIAGFVSLYINALNLLPLGSTDGGRMSQTLFSRTGHTVVQGLTYLTLFVYGVFGGGDISNIFLAYGLFCLLAQGDMEIPCRNEVDWVDFRRVLVALITWLIMALVLIPV